MSNPSQALVSIAAVPTARATLLSLVFAAAALIPLLQAAGGMFASLGEAPLANVYVLGCAVSVAIDRPCEALALGPLAGCAVRGFRHSVSI